MISIDNALAPIANFVFAHGAGAGKDSDFMNSVAQQLAEKGVNVYRFNFEYMQKALKLNRRHPPNKIDQLCAYFNQVIEQTPSDLPLFIGGKSMGGRVASMILSQSKAQGTICFGYPFHPPGKQDKLRIAHLQDLDKPMLILQGERDTFGTRSEISGYSLSTHVSCEFLSDGDHSLKPRKASGLTHAENIESATDKAVCFIKRSLGTI